jgi:hypothetical protein
MRGLGVTRLVTLLLAFVVSCAAGSRLMGPEARSQPAGARCHMTGSGGLVRPDDRCTPGEYVVLTRVQVCRHKQRPSLSVDVKGRIVRRYGYRRWSGHDGELDHRVPFFLGGATTEDNLWPEPGAIPNRKDRVERLVYERVCSAGSMTVAQARLVFLGDWTKFGGA